MVNESGVLPPYEVVQPYTEPEDILSKIAHIDLSSGTLLIGITAFAASAIFGILTGHLILGGTVGLILLGIDLVSPIAAWILLGFPRFLVQIGVHPLIITVFTVIFAYPWFWFLLNVILQRPVEDY